MTLVAGRYRLLSQLGQGGMGTVWRAMDELLRQEVAAHAAGILHRDVKPANVLLTDDGRVLLTDFGIATIAGDTGITQTGMLTGSPGYIAPERLRGEVDGPLADLWSLGATLFTAVEGVAPFAGPNQAAVLAAVLMQEPTPFRLAGPLAPVLAAILEKDPAGRCSADEAAGWLEALSRDDTTTSPALRRRRTAPGRPSRRLRSRVLIGAALALVMTVVVGVVIVPYLFPNVIRILGYALAPPVTYSAVPKFLPTAAATPLIARDFEACDLLNSNQTRSLFGGAMKRQFWSDSSCSWSKADGANLHVTAFRLPSASAAGLYHKQMVEQMKDEPKRNPGTKLRKGPDVGDEALSYTRRSPYGLPVYQSYISFRLSNVVVVINVSARRPGYATADRAAKLVAAAVNRHR